MPKIPALPTLTAPDPLDEIVIEDVSGPTTKKMTLQAVRDFLAIPTGWISFDPVTLTYASSSTFNTSSDLSAVLSKGDKIWITQTTTKYFYVMDVVGTLVTVNAHAGNVIANAAITSPYYSKQSNPSGFPGKFNLSPAYGASGTMFWTGAAFNVSQFWMEGSHVTVQFSGTGTTSGTATDTIYIDLPAGIFTQNAFMTFPAQYADGGALRGGGYAYFIDSNTIGVAKIDSSNWGIGAGRRIDFTATFVLL